MTTPSTPAAAPKGTGPPLSVRGRRPRGEPFRAGTCRPLAMACSTELTALSGRVNTVEAASASGLGVLAAAAGAAGESMSEASGTVTRRGSRSSVVTLPAHSVAPPVSEARRGPLVCSPGCESTDTRRGEELRGSAERGAPRTALSARTAASETGGAAAWSVVWLRPSEKRSSREFASTTGSESGKATAGEFTGGTASTAEAVARESAGVAACSATSGARPDTLSDACEARLKSELSAWTVTAIAARSDALDARRRLEASSGACTTSNARSEEFDAHLGPDASAGACTASNARSEEFDARLGPDASVNAASSANEGSRGRDCCAVSLVAAAGGACTTATGASGSGARLEGFGWDGRLGPPEGGSPAPPRGSKE